MKQVVLNLSTRRHGDKKTYTRDLAKPKSASIHLPARSFEPHDELNVSKPGSIALVSSYKVLLIVNMDGMPTKNILSEARKHYAVFNFTSKDIVPQKLEDT